MTSPACDKNIMREAARTIREAQKRGELTPEQTSLLEAGGFPFSTVATCTDHTGQEFPSLKAMCEAWGVARGTFKRRMNVMGWTLEQALTGNGPDLVYDHTGQGFPSVRAMCEAWGMDYANYKARIKQGWTAEEALTSKKKARGTAKPCTDHLGQEFPSELAMCKHWGISTSTFQNRTQRAGWTVEQALTGFGPESKRDHTGRLFPSQKAMAEAWGISNRCYWSRRNSGWTVEQALTGYGPDSKRDHTGRLYPSQKAMCEAWGVDAAIFSKHINSGWTLEQALTGNRDGKAWSISCKDHLGQEYPSISAMCRAWNVSDFSYRSRIANGWTLEEALTGNREKICEMKYADHLGQKYPTQRAMCKAWDISESAYRHRIRRGWSLEEALTGNRKKGGDPQ